MKSSIILTMFLLGQYIASFAQSNHSEKESVKSTIKQLFDAMREGDTIKLKETFHESIRFQTVYINPNTKEFTLHTEASAEKFITQVGKPHKQAYDERILSYNIQANNNVASVWTPYEFYIGDTFSHCGVNTFQLFKSKEGWKIVSILDTRKRENCK